MAFFNYSTMQMTAKVVYYGPGLCGKTTNLQFIYGHTADHSRGEMVSLETQTDRTLFFDLLPMEVGTVAGFKTRIQLYTVPGQVFYNTTRKLVLKGVDGVVFVADSQEPMMHANVEALNNLEENLAELGLSVESLPLVLQYNKRDLPNPTPVEELDRSLNRGDWAAFEASALTGEGVFDTLRGISRLTLISLRKQLEAGSGASANVAQTASPPVPESAPEEPRVIEPPPELPDRGKEPKPPILTAELGTQRHRRDYLLRLPEQEFRRLRQVAVTLQLEDDQEGIIREARSVRLAIENSDNLAEVLIQLNLALRPED